MNTLREIVNFVGIPQGALANARYQYSGPWTRGLQNVNLLVTRGAQPASTRNIIRLLQNLTPLTLEAELVEAHSGEDPFNPVIRINASGGITWFTTIEFYRNGNTLTGSNDVDNAGGSFSSMSLSTGSWQIVVTRSGISNTGFVSLKKALGNIIVSRQQPPPDEPQRPVKPFIAVHGNGDGSFIVSGSNFLPNTTVHIRVVDTAFTTRWFDHTSNREGKIEDYPTGRICQLPGQLFFSANDGRSDREDLTGTLWSNTVTTTCPA